MPLGIESGSSVLQVVSLPGELLGKPLKKKKNLTIVKNLKNNLNI